LLLDEGVTERAKPWLLQTALHALYETFCTVQDLPMSPLWELTWSLQL
jgi:hypothetical protein